MKHLVVIITNVCNMKCSFCLRAKDKISIDLGLFKKILKQAKKLKYDTICLTGGESFLHPEFDELIELIVKEGLKFTLVSNGKDYKKYIPLLKHRNFKRITFSLDAADEKIHDKIRGKGSFKKVTEAIRYFSDKVATHTSICLNKSNKNEIKNFVYLSERLGAKRVNFLSVISTSKKDRYALSDKEKQECCEIIDELKKKTAVNIQVMSSLRANEGVNFCCALELTDMAVNPKGDLIFCCDTTGNGAVLGSLKKKSLSELIKKGREVSEFLKEKRLQHYLGDEFFEGFNTCVFCNKYLQHLKK